MDRLLSGLWHFSLLLLPPAGRDGLYREHVTVRCLHPKGLAARWFFRSTGSGLDCNFGILPYHYLLVCGNLG